MNFQAGFLVIAAALAWPCLAMELKVEPAAPFCDVAQVAETAAPAAAATRLGASHAVQGRKDIAWAWLGSPTSRYPHAALGSREHAASLHVIARAFDAKGIPALHETIYRLPANRVFEDLLPRLIDLDQDGRDEIVLVESDTLRGSSLVVLGLRAASGSVGAAAISITELARGPDTGSSFRWLNPAGAADFDGDGRLDLAAVITPHIGGELTLYHYRPPRLVPFAKTADVSNHRMGTTEQQLAATVTQAGQRPAIIVPDMTLQALRAFRWDAPGVWREPADIAPLPARAARITPLPDGACVLLADGSWRRATLTP